MKGRLSIAACHRYLISTLNKGRGVNSVTERRRYSSNQAALNVFIGKTGEIGNLDDSFKDFLNSNRVNQSCQNVESTAALIEDRIQSGVAKSSFLLTNLATVVGQMTQWKNELPMVEPFYAVKCNPDPVILRLLASMGCNFDCATMGEIDLVLNHLGPELSFAPRGKAGTSLIYAHPAKMEHMLNYAIGNGVGMTVFDGEDELYKIASAPGGKKIQLLLRLTTDDRSSVCRFSKKFGCPVAESPHLLKVAKSLGLNVVGCSFHVGSGCGDPRAYSIALDHCKSVFRTAESLGLPPLTVVDIGGGFPGDSGGYGGPGMPTFQQLASTIRSDIMTFCDGLSNRSLDEIRFIAEPGRYFVSSSTTVTSLVYSRKGGKKNVSQALYLDDGVYGSFNNIVYDHATPIPKLVKRFSNTSTTDSELIPTAIFGPTCDGLDQICSIDSTLLERCEINDWISFENMGAYTHTASFVFNGYTHYPKRSYCFI